MTWGFLLPSARIIMGLAGSYFIEVDFTVGEEISLYGLLFFLEYSYISYERVDLVLVLGVNEWLLSRIRIILSRWYLPSDFS